MALFRDLKRMAPKKKFKAELLLLGSFDDKKEFGEIIEDPYYVSWRLRIHIMCCVS